MSEKDLICKGWESLDEDQVIREVATKGNYIDLCLIYLSKKKKLLPEEAKIYFYQKVDVYCNRLIKNRQLFKAEHVLKNLHFDPKLVFFEKAQEIADPLMQEYLVEHLTKQNENYHTEDEEVLKQNWSIFSCLKGDRKLFNECVSTEDPVIDFNNLTFSKFYNLKDGLKKNAAIICYFTCENPSIAGMLDRIILWEYLLKTNSHMELLRWIHTQSIDSDSTHSSAEKLTINAKEMEQYLKGFGIKDQEPNVFETTAICESMAKHSTPFIQSLSELYMKWSIDEPMVDMLQRYDVKTNEAVLNGLARLGHFVKSEEENIEIILRRLIASGSNMSMVRNNPKINKCLINFLLRHELLILLGNDRLVNHELLCNVSEEEHKVNVELVLAMKTLFGTNVNLNDAITASKLVSRKILEQDKNFYSEHPMVKLFENINDINFANYNEQYKPSFAKLLHLNAFVDRVLQPSPNSTFQLTELVQKSIGIDIVAMKNRLTDVTNTELYFGNPILSKKYGYKFHLGYVHYIKQCRSSFAVFIFAIDQLNVYGKIAKPQVMTAVKKASEIAIANHDNLELCCHCVAFIEMLGVDTTRLRATLRCLNMIAMSDAHQLTSFSSTKLMAAELETVTLNARLTDLEATKLFCETFDLPPPQAYLKSLCRQNDWVEFLLLNDYFQFPKKPILKMCRDDFTNSNLGLNLWRALKFDTEAMDGGKRKLSISLKRKRSIKTELSTDNVGQTLHSSTESNATRYLQLERFLCHEYDKDLFAILIQCTSDVPKSVFEWDNFKSLLTSRDSVEDSTTTSSSIKLLRMCIRMRWPLLAIFAADENNCFTDFGWIAWLFTSIITNLEETSLLAGHCDTLASCAQYLIERAVQTGCTAALLLSFQIFFPESPIINLLEYVDATHRHDFSSHTTFQLKNYLHVLNNREMVPEIFDNRSTCINYSIKLLVVHLENNFQSLSHQQHFLESLCESDISYFNTIVDFCLLKQVFDIIEFTEVEVSNFHFFCRDTYSDVDIRDEYIKIQNSLVVHKYYDKALALSALLKLEKDNIIYQSWVNSYDADSDAFDMEVCEVETKKHGIKPLLMLNFYIYMSKRSSIGHAMRYRILKKTLESIRRHQLYYEFDQDAIEYEMLVAYVRFEMGTDTDSNSSSSFVELDIYHSEYYEMVFTKERSVLYNSFVELKEMAGIDDLTVVSRKLESSAEIGRLEALIHMLLEKGDIIQALRCQAIFDHRPIDLHFIVFCMALAEDLVTLYDIPKAERRLLNDNLNTMAIRFNKRTLRPNKISQTSMSSSPSRQTPVEMSDTSGGLLEFEEIPSREKQDVLEAMEGLASQIQNGIKIVRRVIMVYRASMFLDKDYTDILKVKNPYLLLQMAINDDCLNKLVVLHDIMTSMEMTVDEIADYISQQIAASIIQSRFYIVQNVTQPGTPADHREQLWGFDLNDQFHLILELSPNTTLMGNYLLEYCEAIKFYRDVEREKISTEELLQVKSRKSAFESKIYENLLVLLNDQILSHKKQNTINVELLIKAHDCFVHECSMEGIVNVLQKCKILTGTLTNAKSWNLIVKLLVGIGRFSEMYYCFDTLIKNDQFESLLGQFNEKHTNGLKVAIISYLNEYHPGNNEYYRLAALHFLMYKELAEMWEYEAKHIIIKVISDHETSMVMEKKFELTKKGDASKHPKIMVPYLRCSPALLPALSTAMDDLTHATENHLLDNQLSMAQKLVSNAELVALQMNLISKSQESTSSLDHSEMLCLNVLSIASFELLQYLVNYELSVPQSLILGRSHTFNINWTEAIYIRYVLMGDEKFFKDYLERMDLSENMIENLVKNFQLESKITKSMESAITKILEIIPTVTLRYRLASLLGMKRIIFDLINSDSVYYMKDTDYGRKNEEL